VLYLLKLTQAAVGSQATRFALKLRRSQVEVFFDSRELAGVLPQKLAAMIDGQLRAEGPALDLIQALEAARELNELSWTAWDGNRIHYLQLTRKDIRLGSPPRWTEGMVGCRVQVEKPPPPLFSSVSRIFSEHKVAYSRLRFAPVAVLVDGRAVNDPDLSALASEDSPFGRFMLAERYLVPRFPSPHLLAAPSPSSRHARVYRLPTLTHERPLELKPPQALLYEAQRVWDYQAPSAPSHPALRYQLPVDLHPDGRPLACVACLGIPAGLVGPSKVIVVENGVQLEPEPVDLGCPGAVAVLSAQGLETEGMYVRLNDAFREKVERLREHVQDMLAGIQEYVGQLDKTDPNLVRYVRQRFR